MLALLCPRWVVPPAAPGLRLPRSSVWIAGVVIETHLARSTRSLPGESSATTASCTPQYLPTFGNWDGLVFVNLAQASH